MILLHFLLAIWTGAAALPEDFGPEEIDVSHYPVEHQRTYRDVFLPVFGFLGGPARAINSPIIELDPAAARAQRLRHPELFSQPDLVQVSADGWKREVERIRRRPPCCGACPVLSLQDARALWKFLIYDSQARKTGINAKPFLELRRRLVREFDEKSKERET